MRTSFLFTTGTTRTRKESYVSLVRDYPERLERELSGSDPKWWFAKTFPGCCTVKELCCSRPFPLSDFKACLLVTLATAEMKAVRSACSEWTGTAVMCVAFIQNVNTTEKDTNDLLYIELDNPAFEKKSSKCIFLLS